MVTRPAVALAGQKRLTRSSGSALRATPDFLSEDYGRYLANGMLLDEDEQFE